jgi:hypothetical protein
MNRECGSYAKPVYRCGADAGVRGAPTSSPTVKLTDIHRTATTLASWLTSRKYSRPDGSEKGPAVPLILHHFDAPHKLARAATTDLQRARPIPRARRPRILPTGHPKYDALWGLRCEEQQMAEYNGLEAGGQVCLGVAGACEGEGEAAV